MVEVFADSGDTDQMSQFANYHFVGLQTKMVKQGLKQANKQTNKQTNKQNSTAPR